MLDTLFFLDYDQQGAVTAAPGVIPQLVEALTSSNLCVQEAAVELLWLLVVPGNNPASAAAAAVPGAISVLGDILQDTDSDLLQQKGCR